MESAQEFHSGVVQAFRPAWHGGPEGPHYTWVKNALTSMDPYGEQVFVFQEARQPGVEIVGRIRIVRIHAGGICATAGQP